MAFDSQHSAGRVVQSGFVPYPGLSNPHLQTLLSSQLRPAPRIAQRIERCELPDGDFIDIAWSGPEQGPLAILLHGLTGGFCSKYACGTARRLHRLGIGTVQMQFRGAGDEPNRLDRAYHSGDTGDLRWLAEHLAERFPRRPLYAVGWSLGGNVLLKYLGEQGRDTPVRRAVAASVPFRLRDGAVRLRRGFSRLYQWKLLRELKAGVRRKFATRPFPLNLHAVLAARDFFEFDQYITAPLNGFADAEDYYRRCSSREFLHAIRCPTLIVHALDDPFLRPEGIPEAGELAPDVCLELSAHGGHVGFIAAGRGGRPYCWLDHRIAEYLGAPA